MALQYDPNQAPSFHMNWKMEENLSVSVCCRQLPFDVFFVINTKGEVNLERLMFTVHRLSEPHHRLESEPYSDLKGWSEYSSLQRGLRSFRVFTYVQKMLTHCSEFVWKVERDQVWKHCVQSDLSIEPVHVLHSDWLSVLSLHYTLKYS